MPHLKDLDCSIELLDSQRKLQEFGTTYGDGSVETFVAVPSKSQSFSIHLTSDRFIAPGISMYVFVDGVYQCNRNRQDLKLRKKSDSRSLVDFKVRQKEERQNDGSMIAREWQFEKLDTASADDAPNVCSPNILDNVGCIEVLVLRCAGTRNAKTASAMNVDGANDFPSSILTFDGQSEGRSMHDDRIPLFNGRSNAFGPPPPVSSYLEPYADTARSRHSIPSNGDPSYFFSSRRHLPSSRYSEPISPGANPPSIPSEGYQYGTGPIPTGPIAGSERSFYHTRPTSAVIANAPGIDPKWLNELVTEAVKKGVEESKKVSAFSAKDNGHTQNLETASQLPGAWPQSPFTPDVQPATQTMEHREHEQHGTKKGPETEWGRSQGGWSAHADRAKTAAHVNWDTQSTAESWTGSNNIQSDTWDTDDTWETNSHNEHKSHQWSRSRAPKVHKKPDRRSRASATASAHKSRHSEDDRARSKRKKSRQRTSNWDEGPRSSTENRDGWTHIKANPDTLTSSENSDDTLQPSQSRSQSHGSKAQINDWRSSRSMKTAHSKGKKSSYHAHSGAGEHNTSIRNKSAPLNASGAAPTMMEAPSTFFPSNWPNPIPVRRPSRNTVPTLPIVSPPPTCVPTFTDQSHRHGFSATTPPIAPFGVTGNNSAKGTKVLSTPSSPWTDAEKHTSSRPTNTKPPYQRAWGEGGRFDAKKDLGAIDNSCGFDQRTQDGNGWDDFNASGKTEGAWGTEKADDSGWTAETSDWDLNDNVDRKGKAPSRAGADNDAWRSKGADLPQETIEDAWRANNNGSNEIKAGQWKDNAAWLIVPTETKPTKAASTSKRHTSKSLANYHRHRSSSSENGPKPHWQFPPLPSTKRLTSVPEHTILPPEPLLKVNSKQASDKGVEHQVRAGAGTKYGHVIGRPEYLDTLEKPYAVFRFKYRSRSILKKLFGNEVPDHGHLHTHTSNSKAKKEKDKLKEVSKDELIEKMLKLQTKVAEKRQRRNRNEEKKAVTERTESVARGLTENWVKQHSREASEKGKSEENGAGDGWDHAVRDGGWSDEKWT